MLTEMEFIKQKKLTEEANHELRLLIPSKGYTLLQSFFDLAMIFVPAIVYHFYMDFFNTTEYDFVVTLKIFGVCFVLFVLSVFLLRGKSLGFLVFDIDFANLHTRRFINRNDFYQLLRVRFMKDLMHHDVYETLNYLGSELNQDMAMKQLGIVYVRRSKMKRYIKKYRDLKPVRGTYEQYLEGDKLSNYARSIRAKSARKYGE